jgi:hypothetical protein
MQFCSLQIASKNWCEYLFMRPRQVFSSLWCYVIVLIHAKMETGFWDMGAGSCNGIESRAGI